MVPERSFALTVLTNSASGAELETDVERWALERVLGISRRDPETIPVAPDELRELEGTYTTRTMIFEISVQRPGLLMTPRYNIASIEEMDLSESDRALVREQLKEAPERVRLTPIGPDRFVGADGDRAEFLREGRGGRVKWLRWGGRLAPRTPSSTVPR